MMKRFLFSDNGTLTDFSTSLSNYHGDTEALDFTKDEDAIYIGSTLPFNSLFFDVSVPNEIASEFSIYHWDGSNWDSMVEVIDETSGLTKSGHITWVPSKDESWIMEDTDDMPDLDSKTIYDLYWLKITMSETITATTALNWIGPKFCSDDDLTSEYTLFDNSTFISNYKSGKTDWESEIILASRLMIDDIEKRRIAISEDQLLIRRRLIDACVSKVAQVIFKNLGDDYKDDSEKAKSEYYERLNKSNYGVDLNNNGRVDFAETVKVKSNVFYK